MKEIKEILQNFKKKKKEIWKLGDVKIQDKNQERMSQVRKTDLRSRKWSLTSVARLSHMGSVEPQGHKPVQEAIRGREHSQLLRTFAAKMSPEAVGCKRETPKVWGELPGRSWGRGKWDAPGEVVWTLERRWRAQVLEKTLQGCPKGNNVATCLSLVALALTAHLPPLLAMVWMQLWVGLASSFQLGLLEGFNLRKLPTSNSAPKVSLY